MAPPRWLLVGLRNPEREYGRTRHNIGGDVVRLLAGRLGAAFKAHKAGGEVADARDPASGAPLTLFLPSGYMNGSGGPVQRAAAFYKVPPERLVVVHDELDLPLAALRLKRGGSSSHNGVRDVAQRLGTPDFLRVRVGVGRRPGRQDPADFVLRRFTDTEREQIDVTAELAADAALSLVAEGLEPSQNRFHALVP
jgi:peptidyl-tRNA hydrolase, PTH1 family